MVKYYGRARQRIGSVNTNQVGLKMSGCVSKIGRNGVNSRFISLRSKCNVKVCGPVYYNGRGLVLRVNTKPCVPKAPKNQSFNSGVGTRYNPRFACNKNCSIKMLNESINKPEIKLISELAEELAEELTEELVEEKADKVGPISLKPSPEILEALANDPELIFNPEFEFDPTRVVSLAHVSNVDD